ncbi:UPF0488 protein CG14286-like [Tetranychus urticae]|uniref:Uncharacterized protein n=1 Tax=Tetranychus urticae TaxID=32264 RepID=T1KBB1_TETUR|nr:UPF0488 protein CG14286-like [Tetranychus urticae]
MKGKVKSKPKLSEAPTANAPASDNNESEDIKDKMDEFNIQLNWCLTNLKAIIRGESDNSGTKIPERKVVEAGRVYSQLSDPKTPFVKKRQLMANYFGDYRKKMAKEEEKFRSKSSQLKIANCLSTNVPSKPIVCRKKTKLKEIVPSEPFKFNFSGDV